MPAESARPRLDRRAYRHARVETTPSAAINGMALAALLGYGALELTALSHRREAIAPRNVCLTSVRSFEAEEINFGRRHAVRVVGMEELHRRGVPDACEERAIAKPGPAPGSPRPSNKSPHAQNLQLQTDVLSLGGETGSRGNIIEIR